MRTFHINHTTRSSYDRPVAFGVHYLMIRPRDAHDRRILASNMAGRNLIRVATTRSPAQAMPVSGTYHNNGAVYLGVNVEVAVDRVD